jgi:hypothetical protein
LSPSSRISGRQLVVAVFEDLRQGSQQRGKALWHRDTELQQDAPQVIRQGNALADQQLPRSLDRLQPLLLNRLHRRILDVGAARCLGNGQGVIAVRLVALPERRHGLRRNNPHLVPQAHRCPSPVVRTRTRLEGNQRRLLLSEELRELRARQRTVHELFAAARYHGHLDHVLCEIDPDCC